ncbi:MAG: hypothetical protein K2X87_00635 [Gemmataceae bacterium]|nr:hypothetical protein [Gemmataceae bacterium]
MKLVTDNLVPVALNTDRLPDTADGRFFRKLLGDFSQGLWVVTPAGKVLGFHYHKTRPTDSWAENQKRWAADTVAFVRDALTAAGPLPPRKLDGHADPLAGRGKGTTPDGDVRLAVGVVELDRAGRHQGSPVVDSAYLSAQRWAAFHPPAGAEVGRTWAVPEDAAGRFAPAFSPITDAIFSPRPDDVTKADVTAKLERVGGGYAVVRYAGTWETFHNRDEDPKYPVRTAATGEGVGVLDAKTGKLTAMAWVLTGTYRSHPAIDRPRATAAVIEWSEK